MPSYKYNDNIFIGYYNIYNTNNNLEGMSNNDIILYNDIKKIDKVRFISYICCYKYVLN